MTDTLPSSTTEEKEPQPLRRLCFTALSRPPPTRPRFFHPYFSPAFGSYPTPVSSANLARFHESENRMLSPPVLDSSPIVKSEMDNNAVDIMRKLHQIKDVRTITTEYDKIRSQIRAETGNSEIESKRLKQYKDELDLLVQEKLAHVEELRQIHADINVMETTIKHTEDDHGKSLNAVRRLMKEYLCMKNRLDDLRQGLGLEKTPSLEAEDIKLPTEYFDLHAPNIEAHRLGIMTAMPEPPIAHSLAAAAAVAHTIHLPLPFPPHILASTSEMLPARPTPPIIRQQPPPMKTCLSCHQQIHRNAPICPLCKAKSRSRNPKKPKRKAEDS